MRTQYIGTYSKKDIKAKVEREVLKRLFTGPSKERFKKIANVNYRTNEAKNIEVWLSEDTTEYTDYNMLDELKETK